MFIKAVIFVIVTCTVGVVLGTALVETVAHSRVVTLLK